MFRKKDEELQVPKPEVRQEETAYEDSWYRSLKAMREQEEVAEPETEDGLDAVDGSAETGTAEGDAAGDAVPEELEARAEQLIERLHTLQHLADETAADPEPEPRSNWG
jgi:hypothetical protein